MESADRAVNPDIAVILEQVATLVTREHPDIQDNRDIRANQVTLEYLGTLECPASVVIAE